MVESKPRLTELLLQNISNMKEVARKLPGQARDELTKKLLQTGEDFILKKYMVSVVAPLLIFGFLTSLVLKFVIFPSFSVKGSVTYLPYVVPVVCILIALTYPLMIINARKNDIDAKLHLFIMYMRAVSTAGPERKTLFRMASEKKEYGVVAEETEKILKLADSWNLGFVKACRIVGETTPSILFKDFLDRLAHALQTGEDIAEFLRLEVDVVMKDYERMYRQSLYYLESIKDIYLNMIITLAFVSAFVLIFPMLTGNSMANMVYLIIFLFFCVDVAMYLVIKRIMPSDDILHNLPMKTERQLWLEKMIIPTAFICLILFIGLLVLNPFSMPIIVAISQTPWAIIGIMGGKEETMVIRKDDNFPTFIRSVGSSAGVRSGSVAPIIGVMRLHDYGPLTKDINNLYRRLGLGDNFMAWRYFAGETGSNLIDKFSRIFWETIYIGGNPAMIGELTSKNFNAINTLRKFRLQAGSSLKGMLYSAVLGISVSVYITLGLVESLGETLTKYTATGASGDYLPSSFVAGELNMEFILLLLWILILLHAAVSAMIIKIVDGGNMYNALIHFIIMSWMGAGVTLVVPIIFGVMIDI